VGPFPEEEGHPSSEAEEEGGLPFLEEEGHPSSEAEGDLPSLEEEEEDLPFPEEEGPPSSEAEEEGDLQFPDEGHRSASADTVFHSLFGRHPVLHAMLGFFYQHLLLQEATIQLQLTLSSLRLGGTSLLIIELSANKNHCLPNIKFSFAKYVAGRQHALL
jgi:hypothetical protein